MTDESFTEKPKHRTAELRRSSASSSELSKQAKSLPRQLFPIVGIGASAGGLAAFSSFFSALPVQHNLDIAFVLIQHLDPNHSSMLAELIQRQCTMPVIEAEDGMVVERNHVYVIAPNRDLALIGGALYLFERATVRGQHLAVDFFFQSLAQELGELAIGMVLSGTGHDGSLGVRAIHAAGGLVIAQLPESAQYDGMPSSAIATGVVDHIADPNDVPGLLAAFIDHIGVQHLALTANLSPTDNHLHQLLMLLQAKSGHDFSQYKPSTILRRIERRKFVHQIETIEGYLDFVKRVPTELDALFDDLLIGVTSFFRDRDSFKFLETAVIPQLFQGKTPGATIRVWVAGCSTGEEAYSIAILLYERSESIKQGHKIQIFATDIDNQAIATARIGVFPQTITSDIDPARLVRFFEPIKCGTSYRISKNIRDLVIFSQQNLIKDPPFSKLDLIACRNLFIYMSSALQKRIFPLFHYALNPGGFLFLGTSESIGESNTLFAAIDRKEKVYASRSHPHAVSAFPYDQLLPVQSSLGALLNRNNTRQGGSRRVSLRSLTEQVLLAAAPASVLVNRQGDILYLHGRTGRYLEPTPGESIISNILEMAREGLRRDLTTALHKATTCNAPVFRPGLRVKTNGDFSTVNLSIRPIKVESGLLSGGENHASGASVLYLVTLEEPPAILSDPLDTSAVPGEPALHESATAGTDNARIAALLHELKGTEEYLQAANEELETSNEELKSSNEELQSVNEQLQSTNEELETSKEELQSINEELATVNAELQTTIGDLSRANNDMSNLLAGTGVGTIFVDLHLNILRFTPAATRLVNLISSDIGRPLSHFVTNLVGYNRLVADIEAVLKDLVGREREVQTVAGTWYSMRIMAYRTLDNVVEGGVITFVDITERKQAEALLHARHFIINESSKMAMVGHWEFDWLADKLTFSAQACRLHGLADDQPLTFTELPGLYAANSREKLQEALQRTFTQGEPFDIELEIATPNASARRVRMLGQAQRTDDRSVKSFGVFHRVADGHRADDGQ